VIRERIDGFRFLLGVKSLRYFMIGTILLSVLMAALKQTQFSEPLFYVSFFYLVFLLNYLLVSEILEKLKVAWSIKRKLILSAITCAVSLAFLLNLYLYLLMIGFSIWVLIEAYSFAGLSWELSGKTEKVARVKLSLLILLVYLAYIVLRVYSASEAPANVTYTVGGGDMLFGALMFFYAFSMMGSRFRDTKRAPGLVAVFVMVITLAYVLFVYSPFDKEQIIYFTAKLLGLILAVPVFHINRKIRSRGRPIGVDGTD
jgi:hypothetical protein